MSFESFIAFRYLIARRKQSFISVISLISILGVGLGVASLIVVMGVMNGFSTDLRDKILGVNAHVIVGEAGNVMREYQNVIETSEALPDVVGATPFIYSEVMLSTDTGVKGVVLRGIDPEGASRVLSILEDLSSGSVAALAKAEPLPGIIVGEELATRLGLMKGSTVNLLSPTGRRSAAGFSPSVKTFIVAGTFRTGMFEYDSSLAFVSLEGARDIMGLTGDVVTGVEIKVEDVYEADMVADILKDKLGGWPVYVRDWMEMNANLFAALRLEKTAMFVILIMIVLVGSFSIITTLVMLVMEKTKDIAVLISMGAGKANIRRIFMLQGMIIGVVGTILGFILGLTICHLLKKYQFIELPRGVYTMDKLPVLIETPDLIVIGVSAFALCFLATLYPARQAAALKPAEALRYE
jgi:lipoprotein-releasing system permease protein